ncbi:Glycine/D-amino acid oxidase [Franzmannia pantelleriensis]|uniref:Glycine/D-amino acid oxidase n=1 Tax=Franzmannia pantelleriensis TaxID=48727 RepID=A0A1G9MEZ9_9GAMM|nr:FAD-binding oxidoreductase [Halomonas pantelleriensis]SDL72683.1 Glycine/D-amino acid oxidase [Halomonas pantelleriensis]
MQSHCLWETTAREPSPDTARLGHDREAAVCIVGGGITGLSTALHLAEQGIDSVLLEAGESVASGGSGRNVGLVNAGLWIPPDDIVEALGWADGERVNQILGAAPAAVFDIIERYAIDCSATRTGTLHLGHSAKGCGELARRHDQLASRGAPVTLVEGEACHALTGTRRIQAALLDERAGTLNPAAYTRGLARAAVEQGARLFTCSAAKGIKRDGGRWRVTTEHGSVTAPHVVLATNAYTCDEWNQVKQHFFPGHFFQVASQPLEGDAAERILPQRQGAWDTRMVLSSIRRDDQGRLILGSLGQGEGRPQAYLEQWANQVQRRYFPELGKVEWQTSWTGRIGFTPDHTLRLFEPQPGILAASGYNGRGLTTGSVVGKGFAHFIASGDDALLPLPLKRHAPIRARGLRSAAYESGFTLYHAGQCLRVVT